jgi:hypothetical protein
VSGFQLNALHRNGHYRRAAPVRGGNLTAAQMRAWDNSPARLARGYALFERPGGALEVVRVEVLERYDAMSAAMVREEMCRRRMHVLPYTHLASEKTLAAKSALLSAAAPAAHPLSPAPAAPIEHGKMHENAAAPAAALTE